MSDGTKAYICIIIDDYSRYALAAVAGISATTEWVTQVARQTIQRCDHPDGLVSDNGREFVSVWEDTLTKFGKLLTDHNIEHLNTAPYYPQGKVVCGKVCKWLNWRLKMDTDLESGWQAD